MTCEMFVPPPLSPRIAKSRLARPIRSCLIAVVAAALGLAAVPRHAGADVPATPPASTDLGSPTRAALVTSTFNLNPSSVVWLKFTIPEVSPASGLFLDIDNEGTLLNPFNDSMFALYDGVGNLVQTNDDGGTGALSALSFGLDTPTRPGYDGGITNGQNGSLVAGTYYLAVLGFNGFNTFGTTGWQVTSFSQTSGFVQLHVRLGPPAPVADAGPDQTVAEGTSFTLDASASRGVDACSVDLAWTQIAGPAVTLTVADPVHPTGIAPQVGASGATLTFQLDATSCQGPTATDFVNVTVTDVNRAPVAEAGPDQTVTEGSPVALDGSLSYDVDDDALTYFWSQVSGPAVTLSDATSATPTFTAPAVGQAGAVLTFGLAVNDGSDTSVDFVSVNVENINHPPVADAGHCATVDENTLVTLNASASSDPDNDPLSFSWQQTCGPAVTLSGANTATPTFTAPNVNFLGALLTFRVTVSDGLLSRTDNVIIYVRQTFSPPDCSTARPSDATLWPPNHKLVPITILGLTGADTGAVCVTILGVTQDEPIRGTGNGDTGPDAVILGGIVMLRAERKDSGNGRVYHITYQATSLGGTCTGTVTVSVPHDQGHGGTAIDDGQIYNSVGP